MNLNQITVPSLNVEASMEFYKKLGLRLIVKALPKYVRFECPEGQSTFSVHLVNTLPAGEGIIIYFEHADLDEHVQNLIDNGIEFDELPNDKPWLWREAKLRDLDNNCVVLFNGGTNRKNPPWRIDDK